MSSKPAKKWNVRLDKPMTKADMISAIADHLDARKSDVSAFLQSFLELMEMHVAKGGPGSFTMPGFFKMEAVTKPATAAKQGVNPFTKAPMVIPAKPASRKVKVKALTHLNKKANG